MTHSIQCCHMNLHYALEMAFLILIHLAQLPGVHSQNVTINGKCNFAKPTFPHRHEMFASALIPTANLSTFFCNVWYNSSTGIVRLWLQKTSLNPNSYIISTVLDHRGSLVLPGYVAEAKEYVAYPFHICPPKEHQNSQNYSILLSAPVKTGINLTVQVDESVLRKGETKSLAFGYKISSRLLVFDVPILPTIHEHFLVTVRSDDANQECLLVVSNQCSDVSAFDPQGMNDIETGTSLRLSFTTFGRITLTHASRPKLTTGRWFVGVFLKQHQSSLDHHSINKIVHVSVGFAGGVNRAPIVYLVLISIFGGVAIAVFAEFFLNPEYELQIFQQFKCYVNTHIFNATNAVDQADALEIGNGLGTTLNEMAHGSEQTNSVTANTEPTPTPSISCGVDVTNVVPVMPYDLVQCHLPRHWPGLKTWANVFLHWFYDEGKTFGYVTVIVACSLLTGAAQFIILNWQDMIESGNRDICYYNEGCYRATTNVDIPYNLITSNISYIIHGIILALSLSLREATHQVNSMHREVKKNFSVYYALAWALVFEGVFSSFYHVCPSRMTFQFDSAFMFVISGLVVVAVFNSVAEKASITQQPAESRGKLTPIPDTKLYLFFVVPLLLLNYLGSIRDTNGLLLISEVAFYILVLLWLLGMFIWAFYCLMLPLERKRGPAFLCKFGWLCVIFPILVLIIGFYTIDVKNDWSHFFLFTSLVCVICAVIGYCLTTCASTIYERTWRLRELTAAERQELQWKMYFKWPVMNFHVLLYIVGMAVCWAYAFHYFQAKSVTAKVKRPSQSRQFNKECVLWEFFDYHDLWHILSSFALLLSAYLTMWSVG